MNEANQEERTLHSFKKGDLVKIRPEWQDAGDEGIEWVCLEDGDGGRVRIQPKLGLPVVLNQVVSVDMFEHPCKERETVGSLSHLP
jgi:hypothetical protein